MVRPKDTPHLMWVVFQDAVWRQNNIAKYGRIMQARLHDVTHQLWEKNEKKNMSKKTLKMKDELVNSVNNYIDMRFKNIFNTL